jgi:hypothetical protein
MRIYRCIIIDDEIHAIKRTKKYIESTPNLELVESYSDPLFALIEIQK